MDLNKPYTINFDERSHYLYALVSSDTASAEMAIAYLREIVQECRELGYTRVIVERDIPDALPLKKALNISKGAAGFEIGDIKIAGVDKRIAHRHAKRFGEFVNRSLGIQLNFFPNVPKARRWLLHDQEISNLIK